MNNEPQEEWRKLPLALRLSDEELDLMRWIGARMSRLLLGRFEELPFLERNDELGILVNMIARVTKELGRAKERDLAQKKKLEAQKKELETQKQELEIRVIELEESRAEAARLLETVRKLTAPVLKVHRGVMLVPIAGALDTELLSRVEERVLLNVGATHARVVILDITGARVIEPEIAQGLVRIARALSLLGARVILCGVSAVAARTAVEQELDFSPALLRNDLAGAIATAIPGHQTGSYGKTLRK